MSSPKIRSVDPLSEEALEAIEKCIFRMSGKKDEEYFREVLTELIKNNAIHYSILEEIPIHPAKSGKTKFDQIFDAAQKLAFPDYKINTLRRLVGESIDPDMKIWRVILHESFGMASVLIRANSYQDAFALACDYALRISLRLFKKIPSDISIRVMFVSERSLRRHLKVRELNRYHKRKEFKLEGREFTFKQLAGARIFALGHFKNDPRRSLARYVEKKDLDKIYEKTTLYRVSGVESEILISDLKPVKNDIEDKD